MLAVEVDLNTINCTSHVMRHVGKADPQGHRRCPVHAKLLVVRCEGHPDEVRGLVGSDLGLLHLAHIVRPGLLVPLSALRVLDLDPELGAEHVTELGTITVPSTDGLLLVVVVVWSP